MLARSHVRHVSLNIPCFLIGLLVVLSSVSHCPGKMLQAVNTQTQSIPIFEQYGVISPNSEKAILDNFTIQLLDNQDLTGYVVLRRGQYSPNVAARKLRYIRNYLTKRRGVPATRVLVFEGKLRRDFSVELYLVSKGKPGPT